LPAEVLVVDVTVEVEVAEVLEQIMGQHQVAVHLQNPHLQLPLLQVTQSQLVLVVPEAIRL